jgi:hypothetical protein
MAHGGQANPPHAVSGAEWAAREDAIQRLLPGASPQHDRPRLLNELAHHAQAIVAHARRLGPDIVRTPDSAAADPWLRRPVFICGHHRSGTTLLQQLLDGHPQLLVLPSEATYLSSFKYVARPDPPIAAVDRFVAEWICRLVDPNQPPHFKLGRSDSHRNPYLNFARRVLGWIDALRDQRRFACLLALAAAYRDIAAPGLSPRWWVEKTPLNEHRVPALSTFAAARFIQMVRHPAASLASLAERYRSAGVDFDPQQHLRSIGSSLEAACRNRVRHSGYLIVRYEDLTTSPASEIERVRSFLGVLPEQRLLIPSVAGWAVGSNSSFEVGTPGEIHAPRSIVPAEAEAYQIGLIAGRAARELGYDIEVPNVLRRCTARLCRLPSRALQGLRVRLPRVAR